MSLRDALDAVEMVVPEDRVAVAAIRDGSIRAEVFDGIDEAEKFLRQFPTMNWYFTPVSVKKGVQGRPKAVDVEEPMFLLIDVDPAPDAEVAAQVASAVFGWCTEKGVCAVLVDSGRGRQVWIRTFPGDRQRVHAALRTKFERPGCKIDSTFDAARLVRLPGSVNHKTNRVASILSRIDGRNATAEDFPQVATTENRATPGSWQNEDFCLTGVPEGKRDDAVFRYACRLRSTSHVTKDEALVLVLNAARACTPPFPEHSARDKVERAWRYPSGSEALELALGLAAKSAHDPGAAFEPQALDALRHLRSKDPSSWQRVRLDLKNTRAFRISDLERRMDDGVEPPDAEEVSRVAVQEGELVGYYFRRDGKWIACRVGDLRSWLKGHALDGDEAVRQLMENSWEVVHRPFQPEEFAEERAWNRNAARLRFEPAEGPHPTWDLILRNVGKDLDEPARANGFRDGAHYLLCWLASLVQKPFEPTAFLFFYGPQGHGKSTFHESARLLFTKGCVDAGYALTSKSSFNGEVARAVLCYVEEIDLSDSRKTAYTRIKQWTTGKTISVHAKHETPIDLQNSTHWIHCAQDLGHCAAFPGDTRITVCRVERSDEQIPKEELLARLEKEAAQFTKSLLDEPLPEPKQRLRIPALDNAAKKRVLSNARSALEAWLEEHRVAAEKMTPDQLVEQFLEDIGPREALRWDRMRILREMPDGWTWTNSSSSVPSSVP